jgi:hypothetical protein
VHRLLGVLGEWTVFYRQCEPLGAMLHESDIVNQRLVERHNKQSIKAAMGKQGVVASDIVGVTAQGLNFSCRSAVLSIFSAMRQENIWGTQRTCSRLTFSRSRSPVPGLETTLLQPKNYFGSNRV